MPKKKTNDIKAEIKKITKKKKRKVYFGQEVQNAVVEYNSSTSDEERNQIYGKRIHAAFDKLAENIINTFKFTYFDYGFEDIKHEVVAFMVMNMHKYDHTKGSKAFSYFSVVAKNYLILHNNNNYKKYKTHDNISTLRKQPYHSSVEGDKMDGFTDEIIDYFEDNICNMFKNKVDMDVAYSIIELMKKRDEIENYNKKALYILIREMTNVKTSQITRVTNVFKKHYKNLLNKWDTEGCINIKNKFFI
tara:strand:+ start:89 stop:829 length:741 start_codon:yes stop_codon:yes gene_type:complete